MQSMSCALFLSQSVRFVAFMFHHQSLVHFIQSVKEKKDSYRLVSGGNSNVGFCRRLLSTNSIIITSTLDVSLL